MSLTPPAGTYYYNFTTYTRNPIDIAVFISGVFINETFRSSNGAFESLSLVTVLTVNGTETIDIKARGNLNGRILERTLIANRLN